jgi:hypothetical protein
MSSSLLLGKLHIAAPLESLIVSFYHQKLIIGPL